MKKLVCLGLAALLAVQTTACGVNAQESTAKDEELVVEDVGVTEDKLPERNLKDDRLEQVTESGKLLIGISPDYAHLHLRRTVKIRQKYLQQTRRPIQQRHLWRITPHRQMIRPHVQAVMCSLANTLQSS
ncbi:MAG: hypothetical protein ACLTI1_05885 [Clostridia bacterium]